MTPTDLGTDLSPSVYDSVSELLTKAVLRKKKRVGEFVIGGEPAPPGRFPYFASLRRPGSETHFCGGVLVARNKVLTAAHCLDEKFYHNDRPPVVHIGRTCLNCDNCPVRAGAVAWEFHPQWSGSVANGYDVAILTLDRSIDARFANVAMGAADVLHGQRLQVVGFGFHNQFQTASQTLQVGTVDFVPNDECRNLFLKEIDREFIGGTMMCAFSASTDACMGDSGGPLIIPSQTGDPSQDLVVGVVSLGIGGCRLDGTPAVYTDLAKVSQFLQAHLPMQPPVSPPPIVCQEQYELNWLFGVCPYGLQDWRATGEPLVAALISQSGIATGNSVEVGSDWGFSLANCGCPIYARVFVKVRLDSRDQADRMWSFIADDRNILFRIQNSMQSVTCASGLQLSGRLVRENC
mmetsp:Transcript_22843/g.54691  ORF Transcript_22843/g.54691 Transcript_22843/m.54691 type:complete len:406 (-) Transcript_22843:151-1368(-)